MNEISTAELARQVRDVLLRFQGLADRLDSTYVTKEFFGLNQRLVDQSLKNLEDDVDKKADTSTSDAQEKRIKALEDNVKWVVRAVLLIVITAVVASVITVGSRGS